MQVDDLIIDFLNLRSEKVKFIKIQNYEFAAQARDKERQKSKEICELLIPDSEFVNWNTCDKIIDDYCVQIYNCSSYNYSKCIKSINRFKKLKDLGI